MHRLRNVGGVEIVVIRILMPAISFLDSPEEALQNCGWYFKLVNHTISIEEIVAQVFHRGAQGGFVQGEHVEGPVV